MIVLDRKVLHYAATPYTRYNRGLVGAYLDACRICSSIYLAYKAPLFSPIAYCHGMTTHGDLPAIDHHFWMEFNRPFIEACGALIIVKMDGWDESAGIADERRMFKMAGKPIYFLDPETLALTQ